MISNGKCLSEVSEKGKVVINRAIDKGYAIGSYKLKQLLIIMQGMMLLKYDAPFFRQNIIALGNTLLTIENLDELDEFLVDSTSFKEKIQEYIILLDRDNHIINEVLDKYGKYDVFELMNQPELQQLIKLCTKEDGSRCLIPNKLIKDIFRDYNFEVIKFNQQSLKKIKVSTRK